MVNRVNPELQERLRQAEDAENAVQKLGSLAAEAPILRVELRPRATPEHLGPGQAQRPGRSPAENERRQRKSRSWCP